ncbi:response regulator [Edwardsiella ictaluri]|uniref:response regulator n=1 Tax=Edwardsiella ictaluri TaxID=67780 RepID=UPI0039F6C942
MPPLIWLIEDRASTADPLIYTLETEGFNVCWFNHIQPALDALKQQIPQFAIIQLTLPDGSGLALGRHLQAHHPTLPLLFLASTPGEAAQASDTALPHSAVILPPFRP